MNLNRVELLGNLTRDPELKSLPSGVKVCSFCVATNRAFKDKKGSTRDDAQFHNVVAWGKPAELIAQYATKGSSMFVEGRLQTRSWDDAKSGEKKYRTEVIVERFQFGAKSKTEKSSTKADEDADLRYPPDEIEISPDDIPF